MSVYAKYNVVDKSWDFSVVMEPYASELEIGFEGAGYPLFFNDLSFGFRLEVNGNEYAKNYPEQGIEYLSTDQTYLSSDFFEANPGETVTLNVWANHAKSFSEDEIQFVVPKPEKPFDSWVWENNDWVAPSERPDDDNSYVWSESFGEWVLIEAPGYEVE